MRFAIVGSGPAGFSMAKLLLKKINNSKIDIFERNPHPFGLVRTGIAPDHTKIKNIQNDFIKTLENN